MQRKVVEFTNLLRKSGIRVSVAEGINAFEALDELSIDDRGLFKDALRTTMINSRSLLVRRPISPLSTLLAPHLPQMLGSLMSAS